MATIRMVATLLLLAVLAAVPARAADGVTTGDCAWAIKADPDGVNIAFPDEGAQYWATQYALAPGTEMVITGTFPRARYLSFHAYEGTTPIDALADTDLVPSAGSNPFLTRAKRDRTGTYELRVVGGPRPADPAARQPNTLYAGQGINGEPHVAGVILYRVYLPEGDLRGGVPLPTVERRIAGVPGAAIPLPSCDQSRPAGNSTVNDTVKASSIPLDSPGRGAQPPRWGVARSGAKPNAVGPATVYTGNVFFSNFHNEYLSLLVGRNAGDLVAFRAKAPTFPDTRGAKRMTTGQVRYWSFCTNDFPTTRYVGCLADEGAKTDAAGYVTVIVSDPAHRPAMRATDNWLPAGPYPDFFVLYRHMLAAPDFAGAVQHVQDDTQPELSMGEYYPTPVVCSTAQFSADRCGLP